MKTLSDLKRAIKPGTRLLVVDHEYRPEFNGTIQTVTRVQGNGYYFTIGDDPKELWSSFAKASCYSFPAPDTFRHDEGPTVGLPINSGRRMAFTKQILGDMDK